MKSYSAAQRRYLSFCQVYHIPPLPLSEVSVCLFAAFLAHQGLRAQSISTYLSALRQRERRSRLKQVSSGLPPPQRADWPRLQYLLKGIVRCQTGSPRKRLPITAAIMRHLQAACVRMLPSAVEARMLWAACCLGYFGFMRAGEFTLDTHSAQPSIYREDVAVDSHHDTTLIRMRLRRAKTDPFG